MYKAQLSVVLLTLGIAFAGCGGSNGTFQPPAGGVTPMPVPTASAPIGNATPTPAPATPTPAPTASASPAHTTTGFAGDAKQAVINGKTIWVDAASGLALYFFNGDSANQSNCTGGCLAIWPSHAATASEQGSDNFTIFTRSDGNGMQWAYKGRPLYTFVSDSVSHNATGNGFQNFVLATP
jgi:predicted lipoprotein with Yx(FWY)xxD motif